MTERRSQEANSKLAHDLLINMNEKCPAFCESCLGDGLQLSFLFIHAMNGVALDISYLKAQARIFNTMKGKPDVGLSMHAWHGVARIYKLIRGNRVSRNRFMSSVVNKFEMPTWSDSVIPFLIYCTEILALLPFSLPDEPLYLIYIINRLVQVRAGTLESNMKDFMHLLQGNTQKANGNGTLDLTGNPSFEQTMAGDGNYRIFGDLQGQNLFGDDAYKDSNMIPSTSRDFSSISQNELQKIQADCLAAGAVQLLLKLKRHLKIVYSLDDERCQAFSPTEPVKAGESLSRQNIPLNFSDANIDPPKTYEEFLQRYQDFKNALREDTVDYSTYTASIKRKRPIPRKTVKASRMVTDIDDSDDENWDNIGTSRLNKSAPRGSYIRTRQRQL